MMHRVPGSVWGIAQFLLGLALVTLAGFVVAGELGTDRAFAALALAAAAFALAALRPNDLRELVGRVSALGPLKFESAQAKTAEEQTVGTEADVRGYQGSIVDLRLKLEYKLTYIAKHLLGEVPDDDLVSGRANFVTIGSLELDGLLSLEQARTATYILTWTDQDLVRAAPREAAVFLAAANELVSGVRATVFSNMVRKRLEKAGWEAAPDDAKKKKRRDLKATKAGRSVRVVPVFALDKSSAVLETVKDRLKQLDKTDERYVIVLPDRSKTSTSTAPRVVRLAELSAELSA